MKKVLLVILALVALSGGVWYYATREAPAPKAADLLPETTLLYVAVPDFPKSGAQFQKTQLYALWQEPDVQAFLEKPRAALREVLGTGKADSTLDAFLQDRAFAMLQGEVFLAITRINPPPFVSASIIVGVDTKNNRLEAQGYLKVIEHDLSKRFPDASAAEKRYLGHNYEVWQLNDRVQICHAFLNSLLIFSADENVIRDAIARFAKQAPADAKPLSASAQFQNARNHMPLGHAALVYLNVEQLLASLGPLATFAPMMQKFTTIQTSATSVTIAGDLLQDVSLVTGKGRTTSSPVARRSLKLTSPDTSLYFANSLDLAAAYRQTLDTIAQFGNATLTSSAAKFERVLREREIRLDDLLAGVGPEFAVLGTWREGATLPDLALVAEIKSGSTALSSQTNLTWDAQQYLDESVHVIHVGADIISPSYVVTDKFLIFALTTDYARALIAQSKKAGPTLAANADYANAMKPLPAGGTSYTYCDVRAVLGALYALARANAEATEFVDFGKLPKAETLTKHLAPFVSATVATPELQTTTTYSTLGKPLTFVAGLAGIAGAAQPWLKDFIPTLPTLSSGNPPAGNQTAPSRTPAP